MANTLTLTNTSLTTTTAVRLLGGDLTYSWKNLTSADPSNSKFGTEESQFNGWENPIFNITFYIPITGTPSGSMTWALWNEFVKVQYDGTAGTATTLNFVVGSTDVAFSDYSADETNTGVTSIPIQIIDYNLKVNPNTSNNSFLWVISARIRTTA